MIELVKLRLIFEFLKKLWLPIILIASFAVWSLWQNAHDAEKYYRRGLDYRKQGQYEQAISEYNKAIELNAQFSDAYEQRANVYYDQQKYDLALVDYDKAIQINPQFVVAYNERGDTYLQQAKYP